MGYKYPRHFRKEIWDPPEWVFTHGATLSSGKAAEFLETYRRKLVAKADLLGLTVIRRGRSKRIYFLVSELTELKQKMGKVTAQDVMKALKGKRNSVLE